MHKNIDLRLPHVLMEVGLAGMNEAEKRYFMKKVDFMHKKGEGYPFREDFLLSGLYVAKPLDKYVISRYPSYKSALYRRLRSFIEGGCVVGNKLLDIIVNNQYIYHSMPYNGDTSVDGQITHLIYRMEGNGLDERNIFAVNLY